MTCGCIPRLQVVETLDEREAVPRHDMWLPEPPVPSADDDAAEAEQAEAAEPDLAAWESKAAEGKLADVLLYLRGRHLYCLYCGCQVRLRAGTVRYIIPRLRHRTLEWHDGTVSRFIGSLCRGSSDASFYVEDLATVAGQM